GVDPDDLHRARRLSRVSDHGARDASLPRLPSRLEPGPAGRPPAAGPPRGARRAPPGAGRRERGNGRRPYTVGVMKDLLAPPSEIAVVILRTVVVYFFVLIGLRLRGKHEVGHLSPLDFTLILLIANAVQNAMVGPSTSLLAGLVAAATLMLVNALF